ncbi:pantothenate kinase 3-like [Watersipora subatra]|uniref:pantothenate kinase 3-like n=1 Tax=Watersipora subatra TaxID=2589382 RepID=UPI00355B7EE8
MSSKVFEDDKLTEYRVLAPFTWFGLDIGGSLTKLVYFEPNDIPDNDEDSSDIKKTVNIIHKYLSGNTAYGNTGVRDTHLEISIALGGYHGSMHFIRFPTSAMPAFIDLAKAKNFPLLATTVCATGGGAHKFSELYETNLKMRLRKIDELAALIRGIYYMDSVNANECFFFTDPTDDHLYAKHTYDFSNPYPYLCVNIGSGVSILAVTGANSFTRVGGTSIGGGTFLGLCAALTGCGSFEEAIDLASTGDNARCDKLVSDIYGGDYDKFSLPGHLVASSFGYMMDPERMKSASTADMARSCLAMITYNISSLARLNAEKLDMERVVFVGNFLRRNTLSMRLLSHAMDYWSKKSMKALFLQHEGYFGAVGSLLELINPQFTDQY